MIGFVGMETSGKIRQRLLNMGLDAYSCDMMPADDRWKDRSETFDGVTDFIVDGIMNYLGI